MKRDERRAAVAQAILATAHPVTGRITASGVVAAASDKASILHHKFTWDDRIAAHRHRLDIARQLIVDHNIAELQRQLRMAKEKPMIFQVSPKVLQRFSETAQSAPWAVKDPTAGGNTEGHMLLPIVATSRRMSGAVMAHEIRCLLDRLARTKAIDSYFTETIAVKGSWAAQVNGALEQAEGSLLIALTVAQRAGGGKGREDRRRRPRGGAPTPQPRQAAASKKKRPSRSRAA